MVLFKLDTTAYPRALAIDGSQGAFYFSEGSTDDWVFEVSRGWTRRSGSAIPKSSSALTVICGDPTPAYAPTYLTTPSSKAAGGA